MDFVARENECVKELIAEGFYVFRAGSFPIHLEQDGLFPHSSRKVESFGEKGLAVLFPMHSSDINSPRFTIPVSSFKESKSAGRPSTTKKLVKSIMSVIQVMLATAFPRLESIDEEFVYNTRRVKCWQEPHEDGPSRYFRHISSADVPYTVIINCQDESDVDNKDSTKPFLIYGKSHKVGLVSDDGDFLVPTRVCLEPMDMLVIRHDVVYSIGPSHKNSVFFKTTMYPSVRVPQGIVWSLKTDLEARLTIPQELEMYQQTFAFEIPQELVLEIEDEEDWDLNIGSEMGEKVEEMNFEEDWDTVGEKIEESQLEELEAQAAEPMEFECDSD